MKKILVIGATVAQGGGVARALLASGQFAVCALTRNPNSENAQQLKALGVEVRQGDLNDLQSLVHAMQGIYGVFAVTNFWEVVSTEIEKQQAKNIADACYTSGIEHVIWSTLEDTRDYIPEDYAAMPMLEDVYRVPHLDCKNEANAYFAKVPTTYLITSFFWDNLITFGMSPKKNTQGTYDYVMPFDDKFLAGHVAEDIGKAVAPMFEDPERFINTTVGIQTEALTLAQMSQIIAEELNVEVNYIPIDADSFRRFPFAGAEEIGNNFQYFRDFNEAFLQLRSKSLMHELNPDAMGFRDFVRHNKDLIKTVMDSA